MFSIRRTFSLKNTGISYKNVHSRTNRGRKVSCQQTKHIAAPTPQPKGNDQQQQSNSDVFVQTVIRYGVPAVLGGLFLSASAYLNLDKSSSNDSNLIKRIALYLRDEKVKSKNAQVEYLEIERINDRLMRYSNSLQKAIYGGRVADNMSRKHYYENQFFNEVTSQLSDSELYEVQKAEKEFRETMEKITSERNYTIQEIRSLVTRTKTVNSRSTPTASDSKGASPEQDLNPAVPEVKKATDQAGLYKKIAAFAVTQAEAEVNFMKKLSSVLDVESCHRLRDTLLIGNAPGWLDSSLLAPIEIPKDSAERFKRKHVYVLSFNGDIAASQVAQLREEITAVLTIADVKRGDSVVLRLNSGGGKVTSYGLAAGQLARLREAGVPLTVCVEEVAASGGYMMACVGNKIIASPLAILGSIGVIATVPNFYERLKREGVEVDDVTAGQFKRTLTPYKKATPEDREKLQSDVLVILDLFKAHIRKYRPSLDVDALATGETWLGEDCISRNLCDQLSTSDDIILSLCKEGAEVYTVSYSPKKKNDTLVGLLTGSQAASSIYNEMIETFFLGYLQQSDLISIDVVKPLLRFLILPLIEDYIRKEKRDFESPYSYEPNRYVASGNFESHKFFAASSEKDSGL